MNDIYCGDCLDELKKVPDKSIQLIITSPPYADARKNTYGGILPDDYVEWFMPRAEQFKRILKDNGTFILNIKEKVVNGERHTYVLELILAMRKQGWLWTEEYMWHKKTCTPGKWPNRFRDAWERCLQFNKQKKFDMYQEEVMTDIGDWSKVRYKNLCDNDTKRTDSDTNSGFGIKRDNWVNKEKVYPSNVLHLAAECGNKNHSAVFPTALPEFFIKLFSKDSDIIVDPFAGSGTTLLVAKNNNRGYIGVEHLEENIKIIKKRLERD